MVLYKIDGRHPIENIQNDVSDILFGPDNESYLSDFVESKYLKYLSMVDLRGNISMIDIDKCIPDKNIIILLDMMDIHKYHPRHLFSKYKRRYRLSCNMFDKTLNLKQFISGNIFMITLQDYNKFITVYPDMIDTFNRMLGEYERTFFNFTPSVPQRLQSSLHLLQVNKLMHRMISVLIKKYFFSLYMSKNTYNFTGKIVADEFSVGTLTASNLGLPTTTLTTGQITQNGVPIIQTFGTNNFFAGANAGNLTLTGSRNTALGANSLKAITTGNDNTSLGFNALTALLTGSTNVAIGSGAGTAYTGAEANNIIIGALIAGTAAESNTIRIGTGSTSAFIQGINAISLGATGNLVAIIGTGQLGTVATTLSAGAANLNTTATYQISGSTVLDVNAGKTRLSAGTAKMTLDTASNLDLSSATAFVSFAGLQSLTANSVIFRNGGSATFFASSDTTSNTYLLPSKPGQATYTLATVNDVKPAFLSTSGIVNSSAIAPGAILLFMTFPGTNVYTPTSATFIHGGANSGSTTVTLQIRDFTNSGNIIADVTDGTGSTVFQTTTTMGNMSATQAIWQIFVSTNAGNFNTYQVFVR